MKAICRNRRGVLAASLTLLWLAGWPAHAQQGAERPDAADQNLDVTMKLLPENATRPDAVTRVIELPEAVRDGSSTVDADEREPLADGRGGRDEGARPAGGGAGERGGIPDVGPSGTEAARGAPAEARDQGRDAGVRGSAPDLPGIGREAADVSDVADGAAAEARDAAAEPRDAGGDARDAAANARDSGRDAAAGARDSAADARDSGRDSAAGAREAAADAASEARDAGRGAASEARELGRDIAEEARRNLENLDRGRPD